MKVITTIVGALGTMFVGIALFIAALITPQKYPLAGASSLQIAQVYSEATFYGVLSIAAFVLSGVLVLSLGIKTTD